MVHVWSSVSKKERKSKLKNRKTSEYKTKRTRENPMGMKISENQEDIKL